MTSEKPILFQPAMVKAILDGRKTQTRRIVNSLGDCYPHTQWPDDLKPRFEPFLSDGSWGCAVCGNGVRFSDGLGIKCPYGKIGDVLWVREKWRPVAVPDGKWFVPGIEYSNGDKVANEKARLGLLESYGLKWRPSIHMPRWACRLRLKITDIRIERLHDIPAQDALAEGVVVTPFWRPKDLEGQKWYDDHQFWTHYPQIAFRDLWKSINGDVSWDDNPWVWVLEFEVVKS